MVYEGAWRISRIFLIIRNQENGNYRRSCKKVIVERLGVKESEVVLRANLSHDLGADSLGAVELVMALEEEFGMEIPDEEAEKITEASQAVDYANKHCKNR